MSELHILTSDGRKSIHGENQVRDLLAQGVLPPESKFWKEGMAEWRPLSELTARTGQSIAPPRRTPTAPKYSFAKGLPAARLPVATSFTNQASFPEPGLSQIPDGISAPASRRRRLSGSRLRRSHEPVATILLALLATCVITALCNLWFDSGYALAVFQGRSSNDAGISYFGEKFFLMKFYLYASTLSLPFYFIWLYNAYANCRGFTSNLKYTPVWAVGYYFIPILSFFRPYQVMQEIWKVSRNPKGWQFKPESVLVICWWVLWLLQWVLFHASWVFVSRAGSPGTDSFTESITNLIIQDCDFALLSLLTAVIVGVVTWRQKRLARVQNKK